MFSRETFETLGTLLKDARIKQGFSQRDISTKLGYTSPQFISNIERGLCMPPLRQLKVMIELYNLNREEVADLIINAQGDFVRSQLGLATSKKKSSRANRK